MSRALCHVDFEPLGRRVEVARGALLLEAARQAGVGLRAVCGGAGTCATCRVCVVAGDVSPPTEIENGEQELQHVLIEKLNELVGEVCARAEAGSEVLLEEAGLEAEQVEQVVVAGAFGTYLDVESALTIGLFPLLPRERFVQAGNAAGMGARIALLSNRCRQAAKQIARRVEYVELTTLPQFVEHYMMALMLPGNG